MIDRKELREGNIVLLDNKPYVITLTALSQGINLDVNAVLLTDEILYKIGFINNHFSVSHKITLVWRHGLMHLCVDTETTTLSHINSLHKLQNLYYMLWHEELEASL